MITNTNYDEVTDTDMNTQKHTDYKKNKEEIIHFIERLYDILDNITVELYDTLMGLYKYDSLEEVKTELENTSFFLNTKKASLQKKLHVIGSKISVLQFEVEKNKYFEVQDNYRLDKNIEYYDLIDNKFILLGKFKEYTKKYISIMVDRGTSIQENRNFAAFENGTCLHLEFSSGIQLYRLKKFAFSNMQTL